MKFLSLLLSILCLQSLTAATPSPVAGKGKSSKGSTAPPSMAGRSSKGASGSGSGRTSASATPDVVLRCNFPLITAQCIDEAQCSCNGLASGARVNCRWEQAEIYPHCMAFCNCFGTLSPLIEPAISSLNSTTFSINPSPLFPTLLPFH